MKIKTIWHYGLAFFETEDKMKDFDVDREDVFYHGLIEDLSYEQASEVAQIHPNFMEYYHSAMMPLFQGKGIFRSGTENPVLALESYKTKSESEKDMPYILIWKIM